MSNRKRIQNRAPRRTEATILEAQWREQSSANGFKPLPSLADHIEDTIAPLRDHGASDLVIDLYRIGLGVQDERLMDAAQIIIEAGLGKRDWRATLDKRIADQPQLYDELRAMEAAHHIAKGRSVRQAAEWTAAVFGGGSTFAGAVQSIRTLIAKIAKA